MTGSSSSCSVAGVGPSFSSSSSSFSWSWSWSSSGSLLLETLATERPLSRTSRGGRSSWRGDKKTAGGDHENLRDGPRGQQGSPRWSMEINEDLKKVNEAPKHIPWGWRGP